MSGSRGLLALAALAAAGLSGCLNFAEPERGPGRLEADLEINGQEEPPRAAFRARFSPGGRADGSVRSVENPRIRILGARVEPSDGSGSLRRIYQRTLEPGAGGLDRESVELVGPRLAGDHSRAVLTVPLVRRAGPDSVRVAAGEPLELLLHGVPSEASGRGLERLRWTLRIRAARGSELLFTATGSGSLPDTLRVREEVLGGASGRLEASLEAGIGAAESAAVTTGYGARLRVTVRLAWTITRG